MALMPAAEFLNRQRLKNEAGIMCRRHRQLTPCIGATLTLAPAEANDQTSNAGYAEGDDESPLACPASQPAG